MNFFFFKLFFRHENYIILIKDDKVINANQNVNTIQTNQTISNEDLSKLFLKLRFRTGNCSSESPSLLKNDSIYCPAKRDNLACYPPTPANTTFIFKCPYQKDTIVKDPLGWLIQFSNFLLNFDTFYIVFCFQVYASRHCNLNGSWGPKNFEACFVNFNLTTSCGVLYKIIDENNYEEFHPCMENKFYKWMTFVNLIGFFITIIFVSIAIFIFLSIRFSLISFILLKFFDLISSWLLTFKDH